MASRQRVAAVISLLSAVGMVYCIYRMIPYGLSGEVAKAKVWFSLMITSFVVGIPSAVAYYYFRSRTQAGGDLDRLHVEVSALAKLGQNSQVSKELTPEQHEPVTSKKEQA